MGWWIGFLTAVYLAWNVIWFQEVYHVPMPVIERAPPFFNWFKLPRVRAPSRDYRSVGNGWLRTIPTYLYSVVLKVHFSETSHIIRHSVNNLLLAKTNHLESAEWALCGRCRINKPSQISNKIQRRPITYNKFFNIYQSSFESHLMVEKVS